MIKCWFAPTIRTGRTSVIETENVTSQVPAVGERSAGWLVDQRGPNHHRLVRERFVPGGSRTTRSGKFSPAKTSREACGCDRGRRNCRSKLRMAASQEGFQ